MTENRRFRNNSQATSISVYTWISNIVGSVRLVRMFRFGIELPAGLEDYGGLSVRKGCSPPKLFNRTTFSNIRLLCIIYTMDEYDAQMRFSWVLYRLRLITKYSRAQLLTTSINTILKRGLPELPIRQNAVPVPLPGTSTLVTD